jgi:hypothetical protein
MYCILCSAFHLKTSVIFRCVPPYNFYMEELGQPAIKARVTDNPAEMLLLTYYHIKKNTCMRFFTSGFLYSNFKLIMRIICIHGNEHFC